MDVNEFKKKFSLKGGQVVNKTKSSKFNNVKVEIDGHIFDSIKEGEYYGNLKIKKNAGLIIDFRSQVKYDIVVNGIHIAYYYLDFEVKIGDKIAQIIIEHCSTANFVKTENLPATKRGEGGYGHTG